MSYSVTAVSSQKDEGKIEIGDSRIDFGVTKEKKLPSPADLLVSAFAACCLKNVERFSEFMHFNYERANITVDAIRKDKPPMIENISFLLTIKTKDEKLNTDLLLRNLQKFGTIYNTLNAVCEIEGEILIEGE